MNFVIKPLASAALIAGLTGVAMAQTQLPMITVAAPRTDIHALCPDVDDEIEDTMAATVRERAESANIDVRFQLQRGRISGIALSDAPLPYQRMLRRAVYGLACDSGDDKSYTVSLHVRIVDPALSATAMARVQSASVVAAR